MSDWLTDGPTDRPPNDNRCRTYPFIGLLYSYSWWWLWLDGWIYRRSSRVADAYIHSTTWLSTPSTGDSFAECMVRCSYSSTASWLSSVTIMTRGSRFSFNSSQVATVFLGRYSQGVFMLGGLMRSSSRWFVPSAYHFILLGQSPGSFWAGTGGPIFLYLKIIICESSTIQVHRRLI